MSSPRKKRPTPRFKPPMAQAIARTKALRRARLLPAGMIPSTTRLVQLGYEAQYRAKHPNLAAEKRQKRANAKALATAPTTSPEFYRAVLALCPPDMNPGEFAVRQSMARPPTETQAARDASLTAKEDRLDRQRLAANARLRIKRRAERLAAGKIPRFVFVAT